VSRFTAALGGREPRHVESKNVVAEPTVQIAERVAGLLPGLLRERELRLIETVKEAAYAGKERASLGPQETLEALNEGRVEHLVFDAERDYNGHGIEEGLAYEGPPLGESGLPVAELMIERALQTSARITPVVGDAATALDEHSGVAALLRY
jgi:stalled ribosome rescue protein Dom34